MDHCVLRCHYQQNYTFCDDIPSRGKKLKTNTDAKMESHPKSTTAENNLYNACYYITYKKGKSLKDMIVRAKLYRGSCAATAKPHRGVCVGLSMTFTICAAALLSFRYPSVYIYVYYFLHYLQIIISTLKYITRKRP